MNSPLALLLRVIVVLRKPFPQELFAILLSALTLVVPAAPAWALLGTAYQMQLGNPSGATTDPTNCNNYLIQGPIQAIGYNNSLGQPNWASWSLAAEDLGNSGRTEAWAADTNLPPCFYQVPINAYSGSGYDRGHLCPSGDRTASVPTNQLTFIMSNIMPQAPQQNQKIWAYFETYCRNNLLPGNNELLITCGPSGFGTNRLSSNTNLAVPAYTWKIVVVASPGEGTATNRISATSRVIALRVPNTDAVANDPWQNYRTSVAAVESDTGLTFFTALPSNLATVLRNKIDGQTPPQPAITGFSPASSPTTSTVLITGTNFVYATNVTFNGVSAPFTINSTTNITATVPANAASGLISVATLGGTAISSSSFLVQGSASVDLAVVKTHSGDFTQGDSSRFYTITVTNVGSAASSGAVTVTDTLPAGLTATAIGGTGWSADLGTLTCARSDVLAPGAAYPVVTLTVNVAPSASANVTNLAVVSGGGDTNVANNTATDPTTIKAAAEPAAITSTASGIGMTVATLNGTVNPGGQPALVQFEYGTSTNYGSVAQVAGPLTGTTPQAVSANLSGLLAGTTYHFRVTAANVLGLASGSNQTFTTAVSGMTLAAWDVSTLPDGINNFGPSPMAPTASADNLTVVGLTRGAGVGTSGNAAARAWGGNTWTNTSAVSAVASNCFATFSLAAHTGYRVSFSSISKFEYRRSSTGPANGLLQYQIGSGAFADIAPLSYPTNLSAGGSHSPIDLSGIAELQDVGPGTNVTFRIVNWGGTSSAGTWYIFDKDVSTAPDFVVQGSVSSTAAPVADLAIGLSHSGSYTQGDTGRTYTITVTNSGSAATTGAVTVTNLLPEGLVATALGGSGWTADLSALTCTRSNSLPAGAGYPAIILTVNVLTNAPASVTAIAIVSGGGDGNAVNDTASVTTAIIALAPVELWRLYWFGTTADSGPAADTAVNTTEGMPNLLKYALALNPLEPTSSPVVGDIDTGYLRLTTPKNPDATDVSFHVEVTASLLTGWTTNGTTVDLNTPTLLRAHYNTPVTSSASGYIRLRVSRP